MNPPSPPPPPPPLYLTDSPMMIGTAAKTPRPAILRRRRKISRNSDNRNRNDGPRVTAADVAKSATDTKSLPGKGDKDVLQVHRHRAEGPHRYAVTDQGFDDRGLRRVAQFCRRLSGLLDDVGQTEPAEARRCVIRSIGFDPDPGDRPGPQFAEPGLCDEFADVHHPDVGTDLFDLGEQVRRKQDGHPGFREITDQRTDLTGALR